jgi:hypothetical protein
MMCSKCNKINAALFLLFGLIFLLGDLAVWDFWGIQWYTVLFVMLAGMFWAKSSCPSCQTCNAKRK